jgi:hypothetical protein
MRRAHFSVKQNRINNQMFSVTNYRVRKCLKTRIRQSGFSVGFSGTAAQDAPRSRSNPVDKQLS